MVSFPNAKINIGLDILSRRPDGYHNISSCFYPVGWKDILEIIPSDNSRFTSSGLDIPGNPGDNLCLKAYHLLKEDHDIPPVRIHLHKVVPIGAGLGGGSSDGAFALKMINSMFQLKLSSLELERKAGLLGSDCPFFIDNKPKMVFGTGDQFEPLELNLDDYKMLIVYPNIHISTATAYSGIQNFTESSTISANLQRSAFQWKESIKNDFEKSISQKYPEIENIKNQMYDSGAVYTSMTGSGSSIFGLFDKKAKLSTIAPLFTKYSVWFK